MKKNLFLANIHTNRLNFYKSLRNFCYLLLILVISSSNRTFAQQTNSQQQNTPTSIILKNGANLYSTDHNFNKQILSHKIILENSDVSYQHNQGKEHFLKLIAKEPQNERKDLQHQLKIAENKRQKEALQQVKKEIEKFEKRVQFFVKHDFNDAPLPDQFFSTNTIAKNYVTPNQSTHDFSKFYISEDAYVITQALDFLHSQKYTYYNNKSLDFCFSEVFSVRPPPII